MLGHLDRLLAGMAAPAAADRRRSPSCRCCRRGERDQILLTWSGAESAPAGTGCLHELFEAQAVRTPDGRRPWSSGRAQQRWTYDELEPPCQPPGPPPAAARRRPGAARGRPVRRSGELVAALLGVLKAGAAYVPLDPAYPGAAGWRSLRRMRAPSWSPAAYGRLPELPGQRDRSSPPERRPRRREPGAARRPPATSPT